MSRGRTMYRTGSRRRSRSFSTSPMGGVKRMLFNVMDKAVQAAPLALPYMFGKDKTSNSGVVTTGQHDYQRQYTYKKASRRVRRRARKIYRSFIKNSLKLVGTNTVIKNSTQSCVTDATNPQNWSVVHVGGLTGTENGANDINAIISSDTRIATSGKVLITNGNIDITMRNSSTGGIGLEVDVYEVGYSNETKRTSFGTMLSDAWTETPAIGSLTSFTINSRGSQLFDFPELFKKGVKIFKKTKVFLPDANTATYRMKLKRNKWITPTNDIIDNVGFIKPYYTRSLVFVVKPIVGQNDFGTLSIGCTRKYTYKIYEDDQDRDGILP